MYQLMRQFPLMLILQTCCILLLGHQLSHAQELSISEKIDLDRSTRVELLAYIDNTILLYQEGRSQHYIQGFNPDLKELWKREITFPKRNIAILEVLPSTKGVDIFYSLNEKGRTTIRLKELDAQATELNDQELAIFHTHIPIMNWKLLYSTDRTKVLIYHIRPEGKLDACVYDRQNQELLWMKEKSFEDINYLSEFQQLLINNKAQVFMVLEQNNSRRKRQKHRFVVHEVDETGVATTHRAEFPNYLSYDVVFEYDDLNQQLIAAGLYAEKDFHASGLFYLRFVRPDSSLVQQTAFSPTFVRSMTGKKRKKLNGVDNLKIKDLILRRDGGVICIAEQSFEHQYQMMSTFYNDNGSSTQVDYLYENILVASLHPNGKLHWKEVLYKSQSSENDNAQYSSYFLMKTASNFRLLYNDDIQWNTNIFEYVVDGLGQTTRNRIFVKEKLSLMPEFRAALQIAANTMIATNIRANKLQLLKITY